MKRFLKNAWLAADKEITAAYEKNDNKGLDEYEVFMMGAKYVLRLFNEHVVSEERNIDLRQRPNETSLDYEARLRRDLVEAMCSNRGYASCLKEI